MDPATTFALVIGIDKYLSPNYPDLSAAVNDANSMETYLRETLKVPTSHIISLRNESATRQGILDGFKRLLEITAPPKEDEYTDGDIVMNKIDPSAPAPSSSPPHCCIIIFYAGHGARTQRPPEWTDWAFDSDQVEMLCPSDIGMPTAGGWDVEGIPDRTMCFLLNDLSTKRGNNITLILDCCHSAGLNRGVKVLDVDLTPRRIRNPPRLSARTDSVFFEKDENGNDILTRGMRFAKGFGGKFQDSHVLIAACGKDSIAFEHEGRGIFSLALFSFLSQANLSTTTYASLMDRLKMPSWQTPHCEGSSVDRPLFSRTGPGADPAYIPCKRFRNDEGKMVMWMSAGVAQGISTGELLSVHEDNFPDTPEHPNPPFGMLSTREVSMSSSFLQYAHPKKPKTPRHFYAKRVDWGNAPPKIYCEHRGYLDSVFPRYQQALGKRIIVVDRPEDAQLIITLRGEDVTLARTDPLLTQYVPRTFPYIFPRDDHRDIQEIVGAWQRFNYHLHRTGWDDFPQVRMELHYLEPIDGTENDGDYYTPENYRVQGGNLLESEPAVIRMSPSNVDRALGMTLYNDGDVPIYPYLFYFEPNDLTIIPWFTSPFGAGAGHVDAPLGAHSQFPIGYGNGAANPWQFCFDEGRTTDVGYFKLFLSVTPVNFHSLIQDTSPFSKLGRNSLGRARLDDPSKVSQFNVDSWGTKLATLIQILDTDVEMA